MRRRRHEETDSLDLLLDTICNMFGMIIFVAILAAIIASVRSRETVTESASAPRVPIVTHAETELDDTALLSGQIATMKGRLAKARSEIEHRTQLLAELSQRTKAANTPVDLGTIRAQTQQLQQDLDRMVQLRDVTLRTPRQRELAGRLPVQVVLAEDRLFILNDWSPWHRVQDPVGDRCVFWTTWNSQAIDLDIEPRVIIHQGCEFRTGTQDIERAVTLRSGGGIPVNDSTQSRRQIADALALLDPDRHVISIRADPDSFAAFQLLRHALVDAGYPYDVTPWKLPADRTYSDRIREGTATAQ